MVPEFRREINRRTLIMGILNCTPDSFSDGGLYFASGSAVSHALKMTEEGADIIDIGGESTRPGYTPVDADEEKRRIIPVIRELSDHGILMSVDTTKPDVAEAAYEAGCKILNDIGGDLKTSGMAEAAASTGAHLVIMFNCRNNGSCEGSVIDRAVAEVDANIEYALHCGVSEDKLILDPGIGFGTTRQQDIELTREFGRLGGGRYPVLYAASRKRLVSELCSDPGDAGIKDSCSDALALYAALHGASIVRSHRIKELRAQLGVIDRLTEGE